MKNKATVNSSQLSIFNRWSVCRLVVAVVLLVAAIVKVATATRILASSGLLSQRWLLYAAIGFESAIAVYMLVGRRRVSWLVAVVTFFVLACIAGYAFVSGTDCNCFGASFGPKLMFPFDISMLLVIGLCRPPQSADRGMSWMPVLCAAVAGCCVAFAAHSIEASVDKSDPLEFLIADMLVEHQWPLNHKLHPALQEVETGDWLILILRENCDHCRELLQSQFPNPVGHRPNERTAVFIAGRNNWRFELDRVSLNPAGDSSIQWQTEPFVASPAIFVVKEGKVVEAAEGKESDAFLRKLFETVCPWLDIQ